MPSFFYQLIVDQIQIIPDPSDVSLGAYFWQIIATIFGSTLVWMIKRDLSRRDRREEKNAEAITTLRTSVAVLSSEVEGIRKDLDHLIERE